MTNNKLLLDEYPLLILPKLAVLIGLNESIILQQIHYWLLKSDKEIENKKWIYNTYEEWHNQIPFFSIPTLKRIFQKLKKINLIEIGHHGDNKYDRTNWYTISYKEIDLLEKPSTPSYQSDTMKGINLTPSSLYSETTTETTKENNREEKKPKSTNNLKHREDVFFLSFTPYLDKFDKKLLKNFYDYWTEPNKSNTKMRFELEKTWDLNKRLARWSNNENKFNNKQKTIHDQCQEQINKIRNENTN